MVRVTAKQRIKVATKDHALISMLHMRLHFKLYFILFNLCGNTACKNSGTNRCFVVKSAGITLAIFIVVCIWFALCFFLLP